MKQMDMVLSINLDGGKVSVATVDSGTPPAEEAPAPEPPEPEEDGLGTAVSVDGAQAGTVVGGGGRAARAPPPAAVRSVELSRTLDQVSIKRVEIRDSEEDVFTRGSCSILYRSNGTCTPYRVEVEDESGSGIEISVDSLSSATTESWPR